MSNVNCINKNSTDYMYEDTAGRTLIGVEQANLTAVQAYNENDLFWYDDKLYRVTSAIASGGTIVITGGSENAVLTTVSDELKRRQQSFTVGVGLQLTSGTLSNKLGDIQLDGTPSPGQFVRLSSDSKWENSDAEIDDLSNVQFNTSLSDGQMLAYDLSDPSNPKWTNADVPMNGHEMIPILDEHNNEIDIPTMKLLDDGDDNYVINAYTAKRWSNCDVITLLTTATRGTDTIGTWVSNWQAEGASREGWLWSSELHNVLKKSVTVGTSTTEVIVTDVEITPVFDVSTSEVVSLYAYRIDDDVTLNGTPGGAVAFKFNHAIYSADGVKVGLNLKRQRINVLELTPIPS